MLANQRILSAEDSQFITKKMDMPSGYIDDWHVHPWHQIVFPLTGLLQTNIDTKSFIVPHNGLLYIPANTTHRSIAVTKTQFLAIYLNPDCFVDYRDKLKSCLITPFLKALTLLLFDEESTENTQKMIANLLTVLRDQIQLAKNFDIPILIPRDRRLLSIFTQLQNQPNLTLTLAQWAIKVGASERTLSRICAKEFNQSFSLWRQNVRLVLSLQLLNKNMSILGIAMELGYKSDSSYIYAFKRFFLQTPSKYRKDNLPQHVTA
ncbi:MAG: AraC-like DNA-binding protein/quercetin dioxygenase-like cupin family protein [Granulosicoccus sp.]|jgi:AraC-like DNA-binding protein/quercetin dioxygenase-like cupin family protein